MLTVCTFLWRGWRPVYDHTHVNAWARMIRANCPGDYRVVCITDMPEGITECETYPLWKPPILRRYRLQNCFTRLRLFDPEVAAQFGDQILHLDLDCIIMGDVVSLVDDHPFRILKGKSAPYNGSMWALKAGAHPEIWTGLRHQNAFIHAVMKHKAQRMVGSDQVWLSMNLPGAPTWTRDDGVLQYRQAKEGAEGAKAVFFAGDYKPWSDECRRDAPALYDYYQSYYEA